MATNSAKSYATLMADAPEQVWESKLNSNQGIFMKACRSPANCLGPVHTTLDPRIAELRKDIVGDAFVMETFRFFSNATKEQQDFFSILMEKNNVRAMEYLLNMISAIGLWKERIKRKIDEYANLFEEEEIVLKDRKNLDRHLKRVEKTEMSEEKEEESIERRLDVRRNAPLKTIMQHFKIDEEILDHFSLGRKFRTLGEEIVTLRKDLFYLFMKFPFIFRGKIKAEDIDNMGINELKKSLANATAYLVYWDEKEKNILEDYIKDFYGKFPFLFEKGFDIGHFFRKRKVNADQAKKSLMHRYIEGAETPERETIN